MSHRPSTPPLTRRRFLQASGGGLLLLVVADAGCTADESWGVILSDQALCGACSRCAITCSSLHTEGPGAAAALVGPDRDYQAHQLSDARWQAATCRMCPEAVEEHRRVSPACVVACPVGAARIAEPGHPIFGDNRVRYIDAALCIGCGSCVERCPYQHPLLDGAVARKCALCIDRYQSPPCVDACPSMALRYYPEWRDAPERPFPWEQQTGAEA